MNAHDIGRLLSARHSRDMLWFEVKDGPTQGTSHLRLDALAIHKSWRPVTIHGYEIKVSRGDWLQDEKWTEYARYCTHLWVVAPDGVVQPEEIPEGLGLLQPAKTGTMLRTRRKAIRREIEPDPYMLLYLLMNRTKPDNGVHLMSRERRIAEWRTILEAKDEAKKLGWKVRQKTRDLIESLRDGGKRAEDLRALDAWIDQHDPNGRWTSVVERLERVRTKPQREAEDARAALLRAAERAAEILGRATSMHSVGTERMIAFALVALEAGLLQCAPPAP